MIKLTLLFFLKNASRACLFTLLCCAPLCAMDPVHAMEQTNNQEVSAQEVSAVVALATLPQTVATIAVAHHATQQAPAKKFTCPTCGKNLASNYSLTVHQSRIHSGEKPFECPDCDYASNQKSDLTRHQRTHTGEKPFKCPDCDYASNQKSDLTSHQRRIHSGEKPFKCDLDDCTYACTTKSELTSHQRRIHSGEKPFKCDLDDCTYACTTKSELTVHQRKHTGEKPFTCDFPGCSCACTQKGSLTRHQKTQHANKKRELDDNLDLEENKRYHPEEDSATETELKENLS